MLSRSDLPQLRCILAAAYGHLGRIDEAQAQSELLLLAPELTVAAARHYMLQISLPQPFVSDVAAGLLAAGLRE